jgi:hypothetical protein
MSSISIKRRARRRARSAGGVIFIVALTMSVLAAVGMYALRASSLEIRTAGFERQSTQTHYLSEYGIVAATQAMNAQMLPTILSVMKTATTRDTKCASLATSFTVGGQTPVGRSLDCNRIEMSDMGTYLNNVPVANLIAVYGGSPTLPGSLGSAPMVANFWAEVTDAFPSKPLPGFSGQFSTCTFTVTSFGITQPYFAASNPTAQFGSEGVEMSRARVTGLGGSGCR